MRTILVPAAAVGNSAHIFGVIMVASEPGPQGAGPVSHVEIGVI